MQYLTDQQIKQITAEFAAERFMEQIADEAQALTRKAASAGFVLEITSVAESFSVATVRQRDLNASANRVQVPA